MYYKRKIKCPRHFMLKGGKDPRTGMPFRPFKMKPNPFLKNVPKWVFGKWPSLQRFTIDYDKFGRKQRDHASFYQPFISAAFAIHQIYDMRNPVCKKCDGRCMEGLGKQLHNKNKRLQGPLVYA